MSMGNPRCNKEEDQQLDLLYVPEGWEEEWSEMPEFVQDRQRPYAQIIVRFSNQEDLDEFAHKIGQTLNKNSQCTWYPELGPSPKRKVYVDESVLSGLRDL